MSSQYSGWTPINGEPRFIELAADELENPVLQSVTEPPESFHGMLQKRCKGIIKDLTCSINYYCFNASEHDIDANICKPPERVDPDGTTFDPDAYEHDPRDYDDDYASPGDRINIDIDNDHEYYDHGTADVVQQHIARVIGPGIEAMWTECPSFAGTPYFVEFLKTVSRLLKGLEEIVLCRAKRKVLRMASCDAFFKLIVAGHRPSPLYQQDYDIDPWGQFLEPNPETFMLANFLPPRDDQCPMPPSERVFTVSKTAVQALPPAAMAILNRWSSEVQRIIDHYRGLHPGDPYFTGSIASKLLDIKEPMRTDDGILIERTRFHRTGRAFYAIAMGHIANYGLEEKGDLGRFLGQIEGRNIAAGNVANSCLVVRRWIVV